MEVVELAEELDAPRRSLRLALTEITEAESYNTRTPVKSTSPDEMIIIQRGPRRKPIVWSPVEYDRRKILSQPREITPEKVIKKCDINPRLRRRLTLSPTKNGSQELGTTIAKRLKAMKNLEAM